MKKMLTFTSLAFVAVSGDALHIKVTGNNVTVDKARVVKTDIVASNGVIHVIDHVLLPPGE